MEAQEVRLPHPKLPAHLTNNELRIAANQVGSPGSLIPFLPQDLSEQKDECKVLGDVVASYPSVGRR